ncbi:MAG: MarR family transcriptional regulator [Acidimicrobiales bacterium]|jgi:DNA-binding MarR family transcriptional regulator|nr:MarR family transcriptional regulator [Acidimicrobiales bacterium]
MTKTDLGRLTDEVLYASRAFVAVAARSIAEAGEDITVPQYRALVVLAGHGALNIATLGGHVGMNPPSASRLVARLERKGLVERVRSPEAYREVQLRLSTRGGQVVEAVMKTRRDALQAILGRLPRDRQEAVRDALVSFAEAAGEIRELKAGDAWLV